MKLPPIKTDRNLTELLAKSKAYVDAMTPEEKEDMLKAQRESFVRAEMNWPKPKFHYTNDGTKVYESIEDYYND